MLSGKGGIIVFRPSNWVNNSSWGFPFLFCWSIIIRSKLIGFAFFSRKSYHVFVLTLSFPILFRNPVVLLWLRNRLGGDYYVSHHLRRTSEYQNLQFIETSTRHDVLVLFCFRHQRVDDTVYFRCDGSFSCGITYLSLDTMPVAWNPFLLSTNWRSQNNISPTRLLALWYCSLQ